MTTSRIAEDDEALVAALRAGDEPAFAALVDRHSPAMIRVAMAYVPSRAAAEEPVQETWIAVGSLEGLSDDSIPAAVRDDRSAAFRDLRRDS
jgi:RNA polymerase sigma-70 factor, ECF subfamily